MKTRTLNFVAYLFVVSAFAPALIAQQIDLAPGESRYVVILKRGANPPDVKAFGGRIESSTLGSVTVVIPPGAEKSLQELPGVASIQATVAGNRDQTPEEIPHRSRITTHSLKAAPLSLTTLWNSGTYGYDNLGNITSIGPNHNSASSTYTYDASSRLKTASVASSLSGVSARTETYDYDGFGNITTRAVTSSPTVTYSPSADLSTNRMTGTGISYDIAGNLKTETGKAMNYDSFNMLASLDTSNFNARYIYTPSDERIAVQSNGSTQWTLRDADNKPMRQLQSPLLTASDWSSHGWTWVEDYIWNGGQLVAGERPGSGSATVRRHFHLDHLGSPRLITDNNRSTISLHDYSPFGEEITSVVQEASCCGREEPINFTGHERDFDPTRTVDNDDYYDYMHARMYSSAVGRFLSVDPSRNVVVTSPQTLNRYAYVVDNPLRAVDPDGRDAMDKLHGFVNGFLSDNGLAVRYNGGGPDFQAGQRTGDQAAALTGVAETIVGVTGEAGSFILDATGVGALVGIPAGAVSLAVASHGTLATLTATAHMMSDADAGKKAADLISGSLKKSKSYRSELENKTKEAILDLANKKGPLQQAAKQMKKLMEQATRLREKIRGK